MKRALARFINVILNDKNLYFSITRTLHKPVILYIRYLFIFCTLKVTVITIYFTVPTLHSGMFSCIYIFVFTLRCMVFAGAFTLHGAVRSVIFTLNSEISIARVTLLSLTLMRVFTPLRVIYITVLTLGGVAYVSVLSSTCQSRCC